MYSIRNVKILISALLVVGGCQMADYHEPRAELQKRPIIVDEAMQHRDWSTSVATIPSGAIVAGPTLFAFKPATYMDPPLNGSMFEIGTFLGNIAVMPITALADPPWTPTAYHGVNLPASYTMSPAYPSDIPMVVHHVHKAGDEADVWWAHAIRDHKPTTQP
ncbi:MAG TPA: hypothetical protein VG722_09365 [Tepidisphaeraceae bacterium]|nr:hypothetical protein [Tepidisphaeraceae bacterium]